MAVSDAITIKRLKARNADLQDMLRTSQDARAALGKRLKAFDDRIAHERQRHHEAQKRIIFLEGCLASALDANAELHKRLDAQAKKLKAALAAKRKVRR
jgi:hypothetical protein